MVRGQTADGLSVVAGQNRARDRSVLGARASLVQQDTSLTCRIHHRIRTAPRRTTGPAVRRWPLDGVWKIYGVAKGKALRLGLAWTMGYRVGDDA